MFVKYPKSQKYNIQQSKIRYKYTIPVHIQQKAKTYLEAYKYKYTVNIVTSDSVIDGLNYFINIIKLWDQKSKEINGWTSCYLTINIFTEILHGFKKKFRFASKTIEFANVQAIYQISKVHNKKIIPINNLLFAVFIAIQKHSKYSDFFQLQQILEYMAQVQLLYLIPNYKSRGNRSYKLPWETINDPVVVYRKKSLDEREKYIKIRKKFNEDKNQTKIIDFFPVKNNSSILDSDDELILDILDSLDNEK